jgi:regulator of sirC expression with transglutaminase-like and TPR domain
MNELLLSEIKSDEKSLLESMMLIENFIFLSLLGRDDKIDDVLHQCQASIADIEDEIERAEQLINDLFIEHTLLDNHRPFWPSNAYQLNNSFAYRTISPTLKAVILHYIIQACGFDVEIISVDQKVMLKIVCDDVYAIIFDPVTGECLDWQSFDNHLGDLEGDPSQAELPSMSHHQIIISHLSCLKNALIREQSFDKALKCVDVLLALKPDNPFERRDRGFLLHQLDCFKVAYDDYRYFVEQCPTDPAAKLLKIQLDAITLNNTVFH